MPMVKEQDTNPKKLSRRQSKGQVEVNGTDSEDSTPSVIELGDLTTGLESDVHRLKSGLAALAADMNHIRGEHAGLASSYEKLNSELRDLKLVLAKIHGK